MVPFVNRFMETLRTVKNGQRSLHKNQTVYLLCTFNNNEDNKLDAYNNGKIKHCEKTRHFKKRNHLDEWVFKSM